MISPQERHFARKFQPTETIGTREGSQTHFGWPGAFSISRTINTSLGIPLPECSNLSGSRSPLSFYPLSLSRSQETPHGSTSFFLSLSLSLAFFLAPSLFRSDRSMAPFVPRGMLRTSIILPDPVGFTDTSQEQMNASHFDGFMNILGEDGGWGERICCFRRDPPSTSHGSTLFSPRFARRAAVFGLLAPRRSHPNGARRLGELASFESRR